MEIKSTSWGSSLKFRYVECGDKGYIKNLENNFKSCRTLEDVYDTYKRGYAYGREDMGFIIMDKGEIMIKFLVDDDNYANIYYYANGYYTYIID